MTLRIPWPLRVLSETSYNLLALEGWRLFCDACNSEECMNGGQLFGSGELSFKLARQTRDSGATENSRTEQVN